MSSFEAYIPTSFPGLFPFCQKGKSPGNEVGIHSFAFKTFPNRSFVFCYWYLALIASRFNQPFMHDFQFMKINKCDRTGILSNINMIYSVM
jgi:hypothetical protein